MVTARCFWALIKFITVYLLAFVIAHLLARDMLMVSYIRLRFVLSKIFGCDLVDFLQLAPLQGISLRVLVN